MKNAFITFLTVFALFLKAQVPLQINYQGVARDANGDPIVNQNIGLQFKISTSTNPSFYNETQPSVSTNSLGLFSTKIGLINPLPANGWQNTPCVLLTSININNAGFVALGTSTMASVPYALYALNSGATLPIGVRDGQTLRWDSTAQVWKNSNNLTNDDVRVGVGLFPNEIKSKMHVSTFNNNDSSAFIAVHFNANDKQAGLKAFAVGSTNSNTLNPYNTAIYGSQNASSNNGTGYGVGSFNYGTSNGTGVGVSGIGNSKTATGIAVGVYGSTDPNSLGTNRYAAIFDKGGVLVTDSLMLGTATNTGITGDVLTRTSTGRAKWQTPVTGGSGPFTNSANYIHAAPSFTNNKIVFGLPYPAGGFPFSSRVTIVNPPTFSADTALIVLQKNNSKPALFTESNTTGPVFHARNLGNGVSIYANTNAAGASTAPAIYGEATGNSTNNAGVYGRSNNFSNGVIGFSGSFNGVWGESNGGTGVLGLSAQSGQAGRFLLQGNASGFPAVYIATNSSPPALRSESFGGGSAVEAVHSSSAGAHNSIRLVDGHIASSQSVAIVINSIGNVFSPGVSGCTDVAGTLAYNTTFTMTTGFSGSVTVNFAKNYPIRPVVVVTPTSAEWAKVTYHVIPSTNGFTLFYKNDTTLSLPISSFTDAFSYFVIGNN